MNTPIVSFLNEYEKNENVRLHMPGHKGKITPFDITEVCGADSLYEANGIIAESEKNATKIFGSKQTFYSTEGSSQCIKAMLMLAVQNRQNKNEKQLVLAARNVHKAFLSAAALIAVVIAISMPTVHDYSMELRNISHQLSRIANNLASLAEKMGDSE